MTTQPSVSIIADRLATMIVTARNAMELTFAAKQVRESRFKQAITYKEFASLNWKMKEIQTRLKLDYSEHTKRYTEPEPRDEHGRTGADRLFVKLDLTRRFGLSTVQATALIEGRTVGGKTIDHYINAEKS